MMQRIFSAWGIQIGPFAALYANFVLKFFRLLTFILGSANSGMVTLCSFEFGATAPLPLLISRLIGPAAAARGLSGPSFSSFFFCHQNGHSAKSGRGELQPDSLQSLAPGDPQVPGSSTVRYPRVFWDKYFPKKLRRQPQTREAKKVDSQCQKCVCHS